MKSFNVEIDSRGSHPARGSSLGTAALTAIAPLIWGTTYLAITELLPPGRPFFLAAARVLPAGVILILAGALLSPWRPRGAEWARLTLLSLFNCSLFFPLRSSPSTACRAAWRRP